MGARHLFIEPNAGSPLTGVENGVGHRWGRRGTGRAMAGHRRGTLANTLGMEMIKTGNGHNSTRKPPFPMKKKPITTFDTR